jgi:hypothetical protein
MTDSKQKRPAKFGGGRYPAKFTYGYGDVAEAIGCSIQAARKHAQRGSFDPRNLISVLEFIQNRLDKNKDLHEIIKQARAIASPASDE